MTNVIQNTPETAIRLTGATVRYRQRHSFFRHSYHVALDALDFDVLRGETLGVIGRNGCGKSTLLKLLAGIYTPDDGVVETFGNRVSLLTLTAGFDPELSGYENAILSGMLLGNSKASVMKLLDQIFEFSELEKAIYQPLKTYSSGMRARLGFAIAIIVNTDVLLIDEILGVGDVKFRQKAIRTLANRVNSDQTVVLVSHSGRRIKKLCKRAIWLEDGAIKEAGNSAKVVKAYETALANEE